MFGGSTMIGQGSPDSKTIPSYVARFLNANGYCVHVVNYGIYGYDNIQEILRLFLILKKANHPNIVVFYDGVNDTFADFQNQRVGLFQNAALYTVTPKDSLQYCISLIFRYLERKFVVHILHGVFHISDRSLPHPNKLISAGITDYHNNLKLVEHLGLAYHFTPLFFWQPLIFDKPHNSAYEKQTLAMLSRPRLRFQQRFYNKVDGDKNLNADRNFHNIDKLFATETKGFFLDECHIIPEGNELVAKKMAEYIIPLLRKQEA